MTFNLRNAEVFGGKIVGESVADSASKTPKLRHSYTISNIDFDKMPSGFRQAQKIGGLLSGEVDLDSYGVSQKELVENVKGKVNFNLASGHIKGVDLIEMAKNATSALTMVGDKTQRTEFQELSADINIKDGVLRTDNITFTSKILDFAGRGVVNLPDLVINLKMIPKIKNVSDESDLLGGIRAPIIVSGNLLQPSYRLEVEALVEDLIKNPKSTKNLVEQLKNDFKGIKGNIKNDVKDGDGSVVKDLKNILKGF